MKSGAFGVAIDPILVTFGPCNFCDPNLVIFYLCIYLINALNRSSKNEWDPFFKLKEEHFTFHLQSGTFANRKYEELSNPQNQKMCYPILVTLLIMRPHFSRSSHENVTPSSGTSPLASYKKVPPFPRDPCSQHVVMILFVIFV